MPVRTLTAQQPGLVLIDVQLLGAGGTVTVRTDASRKNAEITLRTADESGASADAVRDADLRWDARGALVAHVQGAAASAAAPRSSTVAAAASSPGTTSASCSTYRTTPDRWSWCRAGI